MVCLGSCFETINITQPASYHFASQSVVSNGSSKICWDFLFFTDFPEPILLSLSGDSSKNLDMRLFG